MPVQGPELSPGKFLPVSTSLRDASKLRICPLLCTLIYSVDGMAGREAQAFEKRIAHLLAEKWERRYSELCGFVRGRMALSVVRSNSLLLRGSRMGKAARFAGQDGTALSGLGRVRD